VRWKEPKEKKNATGLIGWLPSFAQTPTAGGDEAEGLELEHSPESMVGTGESAGGGGSEGEWEMTCGERRQRVSVPWRPVGSEFGLGLGALALPSGYWVGQRGPKVIFQPLRC
jgi:hypothetical protein